MTKAAQLPFQSWLLGAMVAPTPVSALLHSSTMVKAGSYLVLRIAPALEGTAIGFITALAGAFTFAAASALAVGQSNGKRVLAYSTVANLGLIAACACIHSPLAHAAALLLLVFHALSKALLFLCVGAIEQSIGSRHIEDMGGILFKMPLTTTVAMIGMVSMMVPPFGMLIGKWMAIEAAADLPLILLLVVLGSAMTIFFWAKWLGRITTASFHPAYRVEPMSPWMRAVLVVMAAAVVTGSLSAMPAYHAVVKPLVAAAHGLEAGRAGVWTLLDSVDSFMEWPLFVALGLVALGALASLALLRRSHVRLPYLGGENAANDDSSFEFRSLADRSEPALLTSYYLSPVFGEAAVTAWSNPVAALILLTLAAAALR
jgi:ech hydrogenase subunit A